MDLIFDKNKAATLPVQVDTDLDPMNGKLDETVYQIKIENISPNPWQSRTEFDQDALDELAASIRVNGLMQPITLVKRLDEKGKFYIVAGERRWRACKQLGKKRILAIVREVANDQEMAELNLIENVQRSDLQPMEAARAYRRLQTEFGLTHDEISKRTGKDRSTITNALRLLELPADVIEAIEKGWPASSAMRLLPLMSLGEDVVKDTFTRVFIDGLGRDGIAKKVNEILNPEPELVPEPVVEMVPDSAPREALTSENVHVSGKQSAPKTGKQTAKKTTAREVQGMKKEALIELIEDVAWDDMNVTDLRKIVVVIKEAK